MCKELRNFFLKNFSLSHQNYFKGKQNLVVNGFVQPLFVQKHSVRLASGIQRGIGSAVLEETEIQYGEDIWKITRIKGKIRACLKSGTES